MLTFSVIIPTYGRLDELRKCLDTLVAVDPPDGGFEVVIVDDGTPGLWISYLHASARRHWRLLGIWQLANTAGYFEEPLTAPG